jgi:hypothetical protein
MLSIITLKYKLLNVTWILLTSCGMLDSKRQHLKTPARNMVYRMTGVRVSRKIRGANRGVRVLLGSVEGGPSLPYTANWHLN